MPQFWASDAIFLCPGCVQEALAAIEYFHSVEAAAVRLAVLADWTVVAVALVVLAPVGPLAADDPLADDDDHLAVVGNLAVVDTLAELESLVELEFLHGPGIHPNTVHSSS